MEPESKHVSKTIPFSIACNYSWHSILQTCYLLKLKLKIPKPRSVSKNFPFIYNTWTCRRKQKTCFTLTHLLAHPLTHLLAHPLTHSWSICLFVLFSLTPPLFFFPKYFFFSSLVLLVFITLSVPTFLIFQRKALKVELTTHLLSFLYPPLSLSLSSLSQIKRLFN